MVALTRPISHHNKNPNRPLSSLPHGFSFFFWVVGLIMIWLWWGYGLWLVVVVDYGQGGGGAELWVLIMVVVEWVDKREREDECDRIAMFRLFYFFCFLVVDFIWFWLASGGWPPWLPLAPLWATAMTAKPPLKPQSNFRSKHLITTIRRMNNGAIFLSLSFLFYFSFPFL